MSKAPERIWLDGDATVDEGVFPRCFATPKPASDPPMEFVRADLHASAIARAEAAEAALSAAEEALRLSAVSHRVIAGMDLISASAVAYNAARDAEAAIAKIAALKGGEA